MCAWQGQHIRGSFSVQDIRPQCLEHDSSQIAALQVLGCFACALECCQRGSSWLQLINITRLWWNCARPIFNQVCACKCLHTRSCVLSRTDLTSRVKPRQALATVSSIHGVQVPMMTQPTAKATWQVDTPPPMEAPVAPGKAGAGKTGAGKPGVQAPQSAIPTDSGPLPSDALDEDLPSGPVRYTAAK